MWNAIPPSSEDEPMPPSRSKHSATLLGGHLYLLGGRNGNLPLKDLWRYSFADGKWVQLKPGGDSPPCLQEHTAVSHRDALYVFGGEVGFSAGNETPLWVYHVKTNSWRKIRTQKGSASPRGRRGHTALSHKGVMLLYGGYRDLRGSSNELWAFHFESETWHLLSAGRNGPPARHKHSAIVHDDGMWIYGGMTDLHERADLWRFDTVSRTWAAVKTKLNPGSLHSHAVCKLPSSMLLFGGERDGQPTNELWRFHFGTETWDRIHTQGVKPQPRSESVALTISDLLFRPTLSPRHTPPPTRRLRTGGSMDRTCNAATEEERTCNATQERSNATTNKQRWSAGSSFDTERSQTISERCKQRCWSGQSSFEGNLPSRRTSGTPSSNLSILKEISKLSQMNLSRLGSTNKCNYSVLSSTESIASDSSTGNGGGSEMVKSQSSNIITKSSNTPCTPGTFSTPSFLPRDPVSVPNFSLISSCSLTPVEVTKLVYLDNEEAPIPGPRSGNTGDTFQTIHNQFQPVRNNPRKFPKSASVRFGNPYVTPEEPSDETSDYASMETMNKSGNYGSGMEKGLNGQENSQRLSVNCQEMLNNDQERSGNGQEGCENGEEMLGNAQNSQEISENILEISTNNGQARFSNTLERSTNSFDHSDEYTNSVDMLNNKSSTYTQEQGKLSSNFGQEVNKFSSNLTINGQEQSRFSSNFSVNGQEQSRFSSNFSINGQEQTKFSSNFSVNGQEQTKFSSNFGPTKSNSKSSKEPPPMSFSNPNYMAPDLQTILSKKDYVKVLNSPPDSLLEDALGRSNSRQEMVEMKPVPPRSLALKSGSSMPPRSLALKNGCNYNRQMAVEKQRKQKSRASSAGRMERLERGEMTSFCVFLIGGKEHGQVTVFKRPLSVWRLVLSSEIY